MNVKFCSAAIEFIDDEGLVKLYTGRRHHEILKDIREDGFFSLYQKWHQHGFMIMLNDVYMFVNTNEATKYAIEQGIPLIGSILTSEDLW